MSRQIALIGLDSVTQLAYSQSFDMFQSDGTQSVYQQRAATLGWRSLTRQPQYGNPAGRC